MEKKNKNLSESSEESILQQKNLTNKELILFFNNDQFFVFLYKKTERIAAAVYLVTALIKDEESLKWNLRKRSLELLSDISGLYHAKGVDKKNAARSLKRIILEMLSLFDIAHTSQVVGEMNYSILQKELNNLIIFLTEGEERFNNPTDTHESLTLSESFFHLEQSIDQSYKGHQSKRHLVSFRNTDKDRVLSRSSSGSASSLLNSSLTFKPLFGSSGNTPDSSKRREIIVSLLREKNEIQIKDVSELIKECSEKTLQRELSSLVSSGVLKKEGDRRWSKYRLA
jgi:predicted transcriptional regulator